MKKLTLMFFLGLGCLLANAQENKEKVNEFNMTRHLRLAGTVGYRFTSKIEMENTNPDILEGTNIGLVIKFGRF